MATRVEVEFVFLSLVKMMLAQFTCYESINTNSDNFINNASSTARANGDFFWISRTKFDGIKCFRKKFLKFCPKGRTTESVFRNHSDVDSLIGQETIDDRESKVFCNKGIVADLCMSVQWKVATVNSKAVFYQEAIFFV